MKKRIAKNRMTKSEVMAFRTRWKMVKDAEEEELRFTPMNKKFDQLAILMISAKKLGWSKALTEGENQVRNRWNKLRRSCHV
jgi:hypothetical protein